MAYRTTVRNTFLKSEYNRIIGQEANVWLNQTRQRAIATAPRRGGWKSEQLFAQHSAYKGGGFAGGGGYNIFFNVSNRASYARFVHEGTNGHRMSGNRFMRFPMSELRGASWGGRRDPWFRTQSVRGQKANPWLRNALGATLRNKGMNAMAYQGVAE